jgi:vitellogenic carboxypeptidase-like protein
MLPAYADYLFNIGMLDENQREYFRSGCDQAVSLIKAGKFTEAFKV